MGRYVWRKSEIITAPVYIDNPQIVTGSAYVYETSNYWWWFNTVNFSLDILSTYGISYINFFNGFTKTDDSSSYFYIPQAASYLALYSSSYTYTTNKILQFNARTSQNGYFVGDNYWGAANSFYNGTYQYYGRKWLKHPELNPLCFVCANNLDLYPSYGEKSGYWYELIGSIESTQALSLSTLSADTMRDIAIEEVQQEVITNVD